MKKGIETYSDYDDAQVRWKLCIRKARGKFTLDEIVEAAREWEEDIYALVLKCLDGEWEETQGDYVELYRLSDMEKRGGSWVRQGDEYFCSHCGKKNVITPFCPNCGYKMGGWQQMKSAKIKLEEVINVLEAGIGEAEHVIPSEILETAIEYLKDYEDMIVVESWREFPEGMGLR